jgi:hypothetical protein
MAWRNDFGPRRRGSVSLRKWQGPRLRAWTRSVAVMLMVSFVLPSLVAAVESSNPPNRPAREQTPATLLVNGAKLQVSPDHGRILGSFQGKSDRTVMFIHDLHCNYEVQSNIARILGGLAKNNGLQLIGVEGDSRPISVSDYTAFPIADVRLSTADYFMRRGRITGAEYLAITGASALDLQGIETQGLYDQDKASLLKFLNEESQGYCEDLKAALERLKAPLYTVDLAKLDHLRQEFDFESNNLETYCSQLLAEAQRLGVATAGYPVLTLFAVAHRLPVSTEADYDKLLADAEALDQALREKLYTTPDQRQFDHYVKLVRIMENMLNISATAADLSYYRAHRREFGAADLVKFLDAISFRNAIDLDLSSGILKLDEQLREAGKFYDVADQRSEAFVANLLEIMARQDRKLAVMIVGGFHAAKVEAALRRHTVSFLAVKPRLTHLVDDSPYFALLRGQKTAIENLLARQPNLFAPASVLSDRVFQTYWRMVLGADTTAYFRTKFNYSAKQALEKAAQIRHDTLNSPLPLPFDYQNARTNADRDVILLTIPNSPFSIVMRKAQVRSGEKEADYILAQEDLDNGYEFLVIGNQQRTPDGHYVLAEQQIKEVLGLSGRQKPVAVTKRLFDIFAKKAVQPQTPGKPEEPVFTGWSSQLSAAWAGGSRALSVGLQRTFGLMPRRAEMAGLLNYQRGHGGRITFEDEDRITRAWRQAQTVGYGLTTAPGLALDDILLRVVMKEKELETAADQTAAAFKDAQAKQRQAEILKTRNLIMLGAKVKGLTGKPGQEAALQAAEAEQKQAETALGQEVLKATGIAKAREQAAKDAADLLADFKRLSASDQGLALLGIAWHQGATLPPVILARNGEENMLAFVEEFKQAEAVAQAVINRSTPEQVNGNSWLARMVRGVKIAKPQEQLEKVTLGEITPEESLRLLSLLWSGVSPKQTQAFGIIKDEIAKKNRPVLSFAHSAMNILNPVLGFQLLQMDEEQSAALLAQIDQLVETLSAPRKLATRKITKPAEQPQPQAVSGETAGTNWLVIAAPELLVHAWNGAQTMIENSRLLSGARAILKRILSGRAANWSLDRLRAGWSPGLVVRALFLLGQVERKGESWVWTGNSVIGALLGRKGLPLVDEENRPFNRPQRTPLSMAGAA